MFSKRWSRHGLIMAGACAGIGLATAILIVYTATGDGYAGFLLASPIAAFATAALFWWWLLDRPAIHTKTRGAIAGALAGAVAHYVCWLLLLLGASACHAALGACTNSLGDGPMGPVDALWAAALYSLFSLLFFGWLTVPAGALAGALVAHSRRTVAAQ
jgi:hypothetical protein